MSQTINFFGVAAKALEKSFVLLNTPVNEEKKTPDHST